MSTGLKERSLNLLPEPHNTRTPQMWAAIEPHVDFADKTVLDVGCGKGDLAMLAWTAGARHVWCVDNNKIELNNARMRAWPFVVAGAHIYFMNKSIDQWSERWPGQHDIAMCMSVLPYVHDPDKLLANLQSDCIISVIECQYAGDGPGFDHIENDDDMKAWLDQFGWSKVDKIGSSIVECRNMQRSIWRCENE